MKEMTPPQPLDAAPLDPSTSRFSDSQAKLQQSGALLRWDGMSAALGALTGMGEGVRWSQRLRLLAAYKTWTSM
jgi:hypothetical protein